MAYTVTMTLTRPDEGTALPTVASIHLYKTDTLEFKWSLLFDHYPFSIRTRHHEEVLTRY